VKKAWDNVQFAPVVSQQAFFWLKFAEALKKEVTPLELCDAIDESCFVRPSPDKWDLSYMPTFLAEINPIFGNPAELQTSKKGAPVVVVVVRAATRAIDVFKALVSLGPKVRIGQFFAKHKTVEDQIKLLQTSHFHVVVGTPNRLQTLVEKGHLLLEDVQHVVLEMSQDVKALTLLDLNDTKLDFFRFYLKYLHQPAKQNKLKLVLF